MPYGISSQLGFAHISVSRSATSSQSASQALTMWQKALPPTMPLPTASPGPLASPMMNGSSCRPPAGKKLKRQVHPALQAPKKIERKKYLKNTSW